MRRMIAVASIIGGLVLVAGPVTAQVYPPDAPSCGLSDTVVVTNQGITISCDGWLAGSQVTATFFSHPVVIGSDTADAQGQVSISGSIPGDAAPGAHVIRVEGIAADGEPAVVELGLTVAGAAVAGVPPVGEVAVTGQNITVGLLLLAGLLAAGTVALLVGRRRARTTR